MDRETQDWYENQFSMLGTQGWKDFVAKCDEMFEVYNDASTIADEKELLKRKGILELLRWVSSWETLVNETFENLANEQKAV